MSRWMWMLIACLACAPARAQEDVPASAVPVEPAAPAAAEPGPAEPAPDSGRMVSLPTVYHTQFDAYVAGPENAALGVLMVHDRWGLNAEVRDWADRVAALGCRVIAVDLYDGRRAADADNAIAVWRSIDPVWIETDMDAAFAYLRRTQDRVVLMGWGKGVSAATALLKRQPGAVAAMVTYYDSETVTAADRAGKQAIPVLDVLTPRTLAGPPADSVPPQAAGDAWSATEQFLGRLQQ